MIDETPRSYSIRCRRCAESVMIDVPFGVKTQAGYVECSRGHDTTYRFDGVTIVTREDRPVAPPSPCFGPDLRLTARS
jgi:hypothetical protein